MYSTLSYNFKLAIAILYKSLTFDNVSIVIDYLFSSLTNIN